MGELVERVDTHDHVIHVTERHEAVRRGWLHRVAGVVCRDPQGRVLVHRRSREMPWFGGWYATLVGGAVRPGESYSQAAAREVLEELGAHTEVRSLFKFICEGGAFPYWFGIHETVLTEDISPDTDEIAWFDWLTLSEYRRAAEHWPLIPDTEKAFDRYLRKHI
ncbi:NUDIX hydrolase [Streptomyces iconiensis]|uniref:NUDIX domain-containing protein n=1 Tax=Streptomyces iconiensis TaxID=1384038 RepID=A0ABT7A1E5_9ACTN|nr:NUDIX domain-containing protein [Streptomyces iconiensis]MDJ1135145.1 NUDIX domain-containing protein [Streptomyces iconiensis]